ncbi:MAG: trehalose-phosphatase [Candidatus Omnitrophica bacterium]|nr:trehalose-phosphatase [Candidatus Omnitrophota bacterium]MCF7877791.1 trehalose-phosphatase [Candidatus Omnitrophota bacterium]MCF7878648.1 trehalose-phosphatase [Candidatus Omnitrophota bacterium]MCF7892603.1 trehalose-phosphatase [Candidatus Omnitrophota bacterium]
MLPKSAIFDLDGVITQTALVHEEAWKEMFDEYLRLREKRDNEPFKEFRKPKDYLEFVDGKPRYEGVKSFLESRNIKLPFGDPADEPGKETICGLGNKKNNRFLEVLKKEKPKVYDNAVRFIKALKNEGVKIGVASSSKSCKPILETAGLLSLFETRVDGVVSAELGLTGKPEGDIFTTAARNLGAEPLESVIIEDAVSGVQAGRNGSFGLVLGVARRDNEKELAKQGADIVISNFANIDLGLIDDWFNRKPVPLFSAWDKLDKPYQDKIVDFEQDKKILVNFYYKRSVKEALFGKEKVIFFLDYDGTLTPIVGRPEMAKISSQMQEAVKKLAQNYPVSIVSGRMREDVENLVGIKGLFYAGSHGFDIKGPDFEIVQPKAREVVPLVAKIIGKLHADLDSIEGVIIEEKKFSVAVHYRLVKEEAQIKKIKKLVDLIVNKNKDNLKLLSGKKVFELLPNMEWDKGKAIRWIAESMQVDWQTTSVIYIGDDTTDEYAFSAIRTRGTGIIVSDEDKPSLAHFRLDSPKQVRELFEKAIEK